LKFVECLVHIEYAAITRIRERNHSDLDDFVFGRIKPRRFQVKKDCEFYVAAVRFMVTRWRLKAAEHAIVVGLFQLGRDFLMITDWTWSPGAAGTNL